MARSGGQGLKLLHIRKMLLERTDEEHDISVAEIQAGLKSCGISAERKTVYSDIDLLVQFGMDIRKTGRGYALFAREFELPELMILSGAVASSKFITEKKSARLIEKLSGLTSAHNAERVKRHIFVGSRVKYKNELIYYNIDKIHRAIAEGKQLKFKYFEYGVDKKRRYRRGGEYYFASPCGVCWDDENYYMFAYYERYGRISHFRVDRMERIEVIEQDAEGGELTKRFNVSEYYGSLFSMFGGEKEHVRLLFENSLVNVVLDRFGAGAHIVPRGEAHFTLDTDVVISSALLGWLFQFGNGVEILSPESLREGMAGHARQVLNLYGGETRP